MKKPKPFPIQRQSRGRIARNKPRIGHRVLHSCANNTRNQRDRDGTRFTVLRLFVIFIPQYGLRYLVFPSDKQCGQ